MGFFDGNIFLICILHNYNNEIFHTKILPMENVTIIYFYSAFSILADIFYLANIWDAITSARQSLMQIIAINYIIFYITKFLWIRRHKNE